MRAMYNTMPHKKYELVKKIEKTYQGIDEPACQLYELTQEETKTAKSKHKIKMSLP